MLLSNYFKKIAGRSLSTTNLVIHLFPQYKKNGDNVTVSSFFLYRSLRGVAFSSAQKQHKTR
jgi:hypothetical protein